MHLESKIPKISKVAIFLVIAFVLNLLFTGFSRPLFASFFGLGENTEYKVNVMVATVIDMVLGSLLNIILAIWIYKEAKKQKEAPWIWAAFSLVFGLIAAVAFYLLLIIHELRALRAEIREHQNKTEM